MPDFRIGVLASGTGTNLQAILDQLHGKGGIEVVGVGSDKPGARGARTRRRSRDRDRDLRRRRLSQPPGARPRDRRLARPDAVSIWSPWPGTCSCSRGSSCGGSRIGSSTSTRRCCRRFRPRRGRPGARPWRPGHRRHRPLRRRGGRLGADPGASGGGGAGRSRSCRARSRDPRDRACSVSEGDSVDRLGICLDRPRLAHCPHRWRCIDSEVRWRPRSLRPTKG